MVDAGAARADLEALRWSNQLSNVRRFFRQPFWRLAGYRSSLATLIEGRKPLENVAEHSWKVADSALLLSRRFPDLDVRRVLELALLHDKLEIITGDHCPIDRSGTGQSTYAFSRELELERASDEREALQRYLRVLPDGARDAQHSIFMELWARESGESRFIYGIDKLQASLFILDKKGRHLHPKDYNFTIKYASKAVDVCPQMRPYFEEIGFLITSSANRSWRRRVGLWPKAGTV